MTTDPADATTRFCPLSVFFSHPETHATRLYTNECLGSPSTPSPNWQVSVSNCQRYLLKVFVEPNKSREVAGASSVADGDRIFVALLGVEEHREVYPAEFMGTEAEYDYTI